MLLHPTPIRLSHPSPIMQKKRSRENSMYGSSSKRMRTSTPATTTTVYVKSMNSPTTPYIPPSNKQYYDYSYHMMPILHLSYWSWMCYNPYTLDLSSHHDDIIKSQQDNTFDIPISLDASPQARCSRMIHLLSHVGSFLSYNEVCLWSITCHHMNTWLTSKYTPHLQHLVCTRIPPNNILTTTPSIQSLQLRDDACSISDTHMQSILSHTIPSRLQHINLNRCIRLSDASLRLLCQRVPRMTVLSLNGCPLITDHVMIYLSKCRWLTCLSLADNYQLSGISLMHLSKCYKLRVLNASGMNLMDHDLMITQYWPGLRHLSLSNCIRLSVATLLQLIHSCPHLLTLDISNLPLIHNSHLRFIAGFMYLMSISIRGTNTTMEGWNYLRYIKPTLRIA